MAKRVSTVCQYALLNFGIHWTVPSFLLYSVFTRLVFHFTLCAFPPSPCTLYRDVPVRAGNPSSLKCTRTVFFFDASFFQVIILFRIHFFIVEEVFSSPVDEFIILPIFQFVNTFCEKNIIIFIFFLFGSNYLKFQSKQEKRKSLISC